MKLYLYNLTDLTDFPHLTDVENWGLEKLQSH